MNHALFLWVNQFAGRNDVMDWWVIMLSENLPYIFIGVLVLAWFAKKYHPVLFAGYATILGIGADYVIRLMYAHPRPFMEGIGTTLVHHTAESSFPSDHTTFLATIAVVFVIFRETRALGYVLILGAVAGGLGRVYCGLHYPFDIVGSFAVAMVIGGILFVVRKKVKILNIHIIETYQKIARIVIKK